MCRYALLLQAWLHVLQRVIISSSLMYCILGDVYVTRHSNLSEVHVVFHLVTDPSLSITDIAARHPVMVGLRNCLHAASHHDIHTITIPLLMVHKMSPVSSYI